MRRRKAAEISTDYRILIVDDETGIIDSLSVLLQRSGYKYSGVTSPMEAIEKVRTEHYDMLILDYLMEDIHGDKVVEKIREFNDEIYILLLTGHNDMAPPLETIKKLEIQGYCEKVDRLDQLLLLIESAIKSISQMRTIKKFKDGLRKMLKVLPNIYHLQAIEDILTEILYGIMFFVDSGNTFILVGDTTDIGSKSKNIFKGTGKYKVRIEDLLTVLDPRLTENINAMAVSKQSVKVNGGVIIPLLNEYCQTMGVIYVESSDTDEDLRLLEIYSTQASSSLNNAFLHSLVNAKNEELNRMYDELKVRYVDTIEALRLAVDAKDVYTRGHSDRVSYLAVKIGEQFGLGDKELEMLRISGFFHDIGKIGISDNILLKKDKLSIEEYEEVRKHSVISANILSAVSMFREVVPIVKYHHERIDGKGYPEGLKGDEIPFTARILLVADAFDAMVSDRQYRARLQLDEAKEQLIQGAGTQFDKAVVGKLLKMLENYGQIEDEIPCTYK